MPDARREQLLAQVGRSVDQHLGRAAAYKDRAAPPAVSRIAGIACAPIAHAVRPAQARHSGGGAATQDRDGERAHRFAFWNNRKKLFVVAFASSSTVTPFNSASIAAVNVTKAGSLRLPRLPCGARYGASV